MAGARDRIADSPVTFLPTSLLLRVSVSPFLSLFRSLRPLRFLGPMIERAADAWQNLLPPVFEHSLFPRLRERERIIRGRTSLREKRLAVNQHAELPFGGPRQQRAARPAPPLPHRPQGSDVVWCFLLRRSGSASRHWIDSGSGQTPQILRNRMDVSMNGTQHSCDIANGSAR